MNNEPTATKEHIDAGDAETEYSGSSNANYERGDLWFKDGNVILIAEGTAFRVHQSLLSINSEVFRDMFSFPQPADTEIYLTAARWCICKTRRKISYMSSQLCSIVEIRKLNISIRNMFRYLRISLTNSSGSSARCLSRSSPQC